MGNLEKILIVDDESDIRALLGIVLKKEGYRIIEADNGRNAVDLAVANPDIALFILDIVMPIMSGIEVAEEIRHFSNAPILFLTARSADTDKVEAYKSGADDYMVKPFYATDLKLKVAALIKRYRMPSAVPSLASHELQFGTGGQNTVIKDGEQILLTEKEFEMLKYLYSYRGSTVSPSVLYENIWKEPYLSTSSNTVIVHIANLRKKLGDDSSNPKIIRTVWGKGYKID